MCCIPPQYEHAVLHAALPHAAAAPPLAHGAAPRRASARWRARRRRWQTNACRRRSALPSSSRTEARWGVLCCPPLSGGPAPPGCSLLYWPRRPTQAGGLGCCLNYLPSHLPSPVLADTKAGIVRGNFKSQINEASIGLSPNDALFIRSGSAAAAPSPSSSSSSGSSSLSTGAIVGIAVGSTAALAVVAAVAALLLHRRRRTVQANGAAGAGAGGGEEQKFEACGVGMVALGPHGDDTIGDLSGANVPSSSAPPSGGTAMSTATHSTGSLGNNKQAQGVGVRSIVHPQDVAGPGRIASPFAAGPRGSPATSSAANPFVSGPGKSGVASPFAAGPRGPGAAGPGQVMVGSASASLSPRTTSPFASASARLAATASNDAASPALSLSGTPSGMGQPALSMAGSGISSGDRLVASPSGRTSGAAMLPEVCGCGQPTRLAGGGARALASAPGLHAPQLTNLSPPPPCAAAAACGTPGRI